jgi:CspA family cold shock protein
LRRPKELRPHKETFSMAVEFGVVKFFDDTRKWGFIARENGQNDVFVHLSSLSEGLHTLVPDSLVQFEIGPGPKGSNQAKNVFVVKEPEPDEGD